MPPGLIEEQDGAGAGRDVEGDFLGALAVVTGAGGQRPLAHRPQFAAQVEARHRQAKLVPDPLPQIDKPPTHHAVSRGDRTHLDLP